MNIIGRREAAENGLKHFFTGRPCKRGHLRERSVSTGACLGCLSHYAKRYHETMMARQRDSMIGLGEIKVSAHPDDFETIRAFADLMRRARIAGTIAPMVPDESNVQAVNTMIALMRPVAAPPPPPSDAADAKYAMWSRIHGKDIADQMRDSGM